MPKLARFLPLVLAALLAAACRTSTPDASRGPARIRAFGTIDLATDAPFRRALRSLERALAAAGRPPIEVEVGLVADAAIEPDGYRLAAGGTPTAALAVEARDVRGAIYGVLEAARLVRLQRWSPGQTLELARNPAFTDRLCSFHDNPGEEPFDSRFRDPAVVLDAGFNGMIVHGIAGILTYDKYDARLVPQGSDERAAVLAARERVVNLVRAAKREHLTVFVNGDELAFPARALLIYGDAVGRMDSEGKRRLFDPTLPKVQELIAATFDELFELLPELDGVQVRTGEVYTQSEPMLAGNNPNQGVPEGSHPDLGVRTVVECVRRAVVERHEKRYNQRMWGYYDSPHSVPERWLPFAAHFSPDPRHTFSFKHVKTDYWRWNPINPNFGIGGQPQWAEFQMAREYEGKGAFPSYLGRYLAEGPTEIAPTGGLAAIHAAGVRGAWCWARGGGWRGPYLAREDWVALNVHAFVRLLWDPSEDPFELAREWCVLERGVAPGSAVLDHFAAIQRLSEEAVLKGRYIGPFCRAGHLKRGSGWTPDGNWSRDDALGAGERVHAASEFYAFLVKDGTVDEAIAEKERALAAWNQLMERFDAILRAVGDDRDWNELHATALYGARWMEAVAHHFAGCWKAYQWRDAGGTDEALRRRALEQVRAADAAWDDYLSRVARLPGAPTPYEDKGLAGERAAVIALLSGAREGGPSGPGMRR